MNAPEDFLLAGTVIQFGTPPNRIDLLNKIDGISFAEAWPGKVCEELIHSGVTIPIYYIGKKELIKNKQSARRYKDLEDLKYLE